jgi:hypothetical protein
VVSFLFGLLGGVVAWIATTFFAQPLTRFYSLRAEAAEALAQYEDQIDLGLEEKFQPSERWIAERRVAYESCGSGLLAFAASNALLAGWFYRFWPKSSRYYARAAGSSLMALANTVPATQASEHFRVQIISALKLRYTPAARAKSGRILLVVGALVYLAALYLSFNISRTHRAFGNVLIIAPFLMVVLAVPLGWAAFWIGTITGTPLVSFTYAFSEMKRGWRGIVGVGLLLSVAIAAAAVIWPYLSRI